MRWLAAVEVSWPEENRQHAAAPRLTIVRKPEQGASAVPGQVTIEERSYEQGDALKMEIEAFLASIRESRPPAVTGEDGLRALETAIRITELVHADQARR